MSDRFDAVAPHSDDPTVVPSSDAHDPDAERRRLTDELYREARSIRMRDRDRLKELAEQSLELARQVGRDGQTYTAGTANALSMLAYQNATQGDSEAAIQQAAQVLALIDPAEPSVVLGDVYDTIGWARFTQGEFVEATEALLHALRIADELGDWSLRANALDTMSSINGVTGHWQDAREGHLEALTIQEELGDELGAALVRNNLAYTLVSLGDYDAALKASLTALRYVEVNQLPHSEMSVLDTVASVYLAMGDLDTASEYAQRGLTLARQHGSQRNETDNLITLGRIALERQRFEDALDSLKQALRLAEESKRSVEEFTCHELLAQAYEQHGDPAAALAEYRRFHELSHVRINEESEARLAQMRIEHQLDSAKKDSEIHRLRSLALEREVEERRIAQARLEAQASLDPLTGLYNRRHLSVIAEELNAALGRGEPVCLTLFDVDRFKLVNDTYGHLAGDRVLVAMALQLSKNARTSDIPCRYGGDEFLMLLVGMDTRRGADAAERLRAAVAGTVVESGSARINVTISAGVTCADPEHVIDLSALIERADRALYAAKQAGRNRILSA